MSVYERAREDACPGCDCRVCKPESIVVDPRDDGLPIERRRAAAITNTKVCFSCSPWALDEVKRALGWQG